MVNASRDPLDPGTLSSLELVARGRPDFLPGLMRTFADQGAGLLTQIEAAAHDDDATELGAAAHKLGGSCGQIGALALRDRCAAIERAARGGEVDDGLVSSLRADFDALVAHLETRFG